MNGCLCPAAYIGAERSCLRRAILENQCILSEQWGREVDETVATQDFVEHLIDVFSRQFRMNFCRACPYAGQCDAKLCAEAIRVKDGF